MDSYNNILEQLKNIFDRLFGDELSLRDIDYLEDDFKELMYELHDIKNGIINQRFLEAIEVLD